jgi:hypothetical protein
MLQRVALQSWWQWRLGDGPDLVQQQIVSLSCAALLLQVDVEDIGRVYSLFVDVKRSTQFLIEYQEQYMFNEVPEAAEDEQPAAAEGMEMFG